MSKADSVLVMWVAAAAVMHEPASSPLLIMLSDSHAIFSLEVRPEDPRMAQIKKKKTIPEI